MPDEDKNDVDDKNHPETVSWSQYVGIKESLGGKLDTAKTQVSGLEEQLKNVVTPEEHTKVKGELEEANAKLKTTSDELNTAKEATLTEKRATLTTRGIPEDKVKDMTVSELNAAIVVLQHNKPAPDLGGGSGSGSALVGSPMDLSRSAYASSNK